MQGYTVELRLKHGYSIVNAPALTRGEHLAKKRSATRAASALAGQGTRRHQLKFKQGGKDHEHKTKRARRQAEQLKAMQEELPQRSQH
jgi:hypothetical protein